MFYAKLLYTCVMSWFERRAPIKLQESAIIQNRRNQKERDLSASPVLQFTIICL